ncbi:MAG: hypothetical protein JW913_14050 [Chitinispirillaceae bacterium]|nr:hypothetical protein [Chitinispirillaceae bacterium]
MVYKKVFKGIFILMVVTFSYSADSTVKNVSSQPVITANSTIIAKKNNDKGLKKQQKVTKPNTTWSKIKDLFM